MKGYKKLPASAPMPEGRTCTECGQYKIAADFHKRVNGTRLVSKCITCSRAIVKKWQQDNREKRREYRRRKRATEKNFVDKERDADIRRRERWNAWMRQFKAFPCSDCGNRFPDCAMDFDHRDGEQKLFNVSKVSLKRDMSAVLAEIQKCDLVCANCHRVRTKLRAMIRREKREI